MSKNLILNEKAKEKLRIGELVDVRTFDENRTLITDKWIKLYALALRDTNPLWFDDAYAGREGRFGERVMPTAFYTLFNPMENGGPSLMHPGEPNGACPASDFWAELHGKPGRYWGGHAAYNKIHARRPLKLGDRIGYCELRNRDCFEKLGKATVLVCVETEYQVFDTDKNLLAVCAYGNICQFPYPKGTQPKS